MKTFIPGKGLTDVSASPVRGSEQKNEHPAVSPSMSKFYDKDAGSIPYWSPQSNISNSQQVQKNSLVPSSRPFVPSGSNSGPQGGLAMNAGAMEWNPGNNQENHMFEGKYLICFLVNYFFPLPINKRLF